MKYKCSKCNQKCLELFECDCAKYSELCEECWERAPNRHRTDWCFIDWIDYAYDKEDSGYQGYR